MLSNAAMHELRRDWYPYIASPITANKISSFLSRSFRVRQWGETIHLTDRQDNRNAFLRVEHITTVDIIDCYLATNSGAGLSLTKFDLEKLKVSPTRGC